jgi:hypothetical protein
LEEKARTVPGSKKFKTENLDCSDFQIGQGVAAKTGNEWIRAMVIGTDRVRMEVEDIEEDEENPGMKKYYSYSCRRYNLAPCFLIPLPDFILSPEFSTGHDVLALYPSSSCFYKAKVIIPPSQVKVCFT